MTRTASPQTARTDTTVLTLGSIVSGLAAYGFVAIGTRSVGAQAFAPVSVLWSLWAISAAAVTFPIQHWIIRTAEVSGHERSIWGAAPSIWRITAASSTIVFVGTYAVATRLFTVPGVAFPLMAGLLPFGSVIMGFNRGILAARSRFGATAVAILGENLGRLVLVAGFASVATPSGLGWILIAGFGIGFLYPSTIVQRSGGDTGGPAPSLLGGLSGANAGAQIVLSSGPIVLSLLGGERESVTALFAMLAVLRAPHTLALGATARLTGPLTRMAAEGGVSNLRRLERQILAATVVFGIAGAGLGPVVVPVLTDLVFGVGSEVPGLAAGLLTVGSVVAVAGVVEMLLLLAEGRGRRLAGAWVAALVAGAATLTVPADLVTKVAGAFAVAECVALGLMMVRGSVVARRHDAEGRTFHAS